MNLRNILEQSGISLIAVSKTYPPDRLLEEYHKGQRIFGENKVQEITAKYEVLPKDIQWHFIGHLQRNKVKYIASFIDTIHSIDSFELLLEINKQAQKSGRTIKCLLQFHIAQEETKFGFSKEEGMALLAQNDWNALTSVQICGVMGMATFSEDKTLVRQEFKQLKGIFEDLKVSFFSNDTHFKEISMGMSGDWEIAAEEGATLVRIGSLIFGHR
jgi:PLP dependent protein